MTDLSIEFEWADPLGAHGAELRATWGRFLLRADGEAITAVADRSTGSVRDAVNLPLYPIAEWFATHWWFLRAEVATPVKSLSPSFERRHNLMFAQEGFALPSLLLLPTGSGVSLRWEPSPRGWQKLEFFSAGGGFVELDGFSRTLTAFIEAVIRRLDASDVQDTLLHREWEAIVAADSEEAEFCRAAAAMGLDPYALDHQQAGALQEVAESLPASVRGDFFEVATPERLAVDARGVLDALESGRSTDMEAPVLQALRRRIARQRRPAAAPWNEGYSLARWARAELGLDGQPIVGATGLARALETNEAGLGQIFLVGNQPRQVDAVVAFNEVEAPGIVVEPKLPEMQRFAFCRGLLEYLTAPRPEARLVTTAHSDRQKRNRAFAAEFLLPAAALRERVEGDSVSEEQVVELAAELEVSYPIVYHQLQNHHIARVEAL